MLQCFIIPREPYTIIVHFKDPGFLLALSHSCIILPPTSKKLEGHSAFGSFAPLSVSCKPNILITV